MNYPILDTLLEMVPEPNRSSHPIFPLVRGTDWVAKRRAQQTEQALKKVRTLFPSYAKKKERALVMEKQFDNATGTLGEFRALGVLSCIFGNNIQMPKSGSDFLITSGSRQLRVEVTTPAGSSKNTTRHLGMTKSGNVSIKTASIATFGYPIEGKPQDTIQGNAVSRLAALKQGEHQADPAIPSLLWIDFENTIAFPLSIGASQAQPFVGGHNAITSGALWWMNYGRKGDPIFDAWELVAPGRQRYALEFDCRFIRHSRFVGTVCAIDGVQILHQNHLTPSPLCTDWIVELLQMGGAQFESWWVDWPNPGSLATRVELAQVDAHALITSRYPADESLGGVSDLV